MVVTVIEAVSVGLTATRGNAHDAQKRTTTTETEEETGTGEEIEGSLTVAEIQVSLIPLPILAQTTQNRKN